MERIKQIFTNIYTIVIKRLFFHIDPKFKIYEEILKIDFLEIEHPKINCWYSDNLNKYINFQSQIECNANYLLNKLISTTEHRSKINLIQIDSINASRSKSRGEIYENIYLFGQHICVIDNENWTFDECIKHIFPKYKQHRIYRVEDIIYYRWNDRYHWLNSDGSHHWAVANFIATNEKIDYIFDCNIISHEINNIIAEELMENYELFIIHKKAQYNFTKIFNRNKICILVNQHYDEVMIAIQKENTYMNDVIKFLKKFDNNYIFNVNNYLSNLLQKQTKRIEE